MGWERLDHVLCKMHWEFSLHSLVKGLFDQYGKSLSISIVHISSSAQKASLLFKVAASIRLDAFLRIPGNANSSR